MGRISKIALALLVAAAVAIAAVPQKSSAIPYRIQGYLKDSKGLPIALANISISGRWYNSTAQGYQTETYYDITDTNGYFMVAVAAMEPGGFEEGTEMTVAYRSEGRTVSTVVTISGIGSWANLTFEENAGITDAITSPLGLAAIVIVCSAAFVSFYIYRAGDRERLQKEEEAAPKRVERRRRRR